MSRPGELLLHLGSPTVRTGILRFKTGSYGARSGMKHVAWYPSSRLQQHSTTPRAQPARYGDEHRLVGKCFVFTLAESIWLMHHLSCHPSY